MLFYCIVTLGSFVGALAGVLLGVWGDNRGVRRSLRELETDVISLDDRLTREQRKKAGMTLQDQRRANLEEAAIVAAGASNTKVTKLPGRASA